MLHLVGLQRFFVSSGVVHAWDQVGLFRCIGLGFEFGRVKRPNQLCTQFVGEFIAWGVVHQDVSHYLFTFGSSGHPFRCSPWCRVTLFHDMVSVVRQVGSITIRFLFLLALGILVGI